MGAAVAEALALLIKHWDVIQMIIDAIEGKKLTPDQVTKAVESAMTAASDAEMAREFPNG